LQLGIHRIFFAVTIGKYDILISSPDNLKNIFHYLVVSQETFTLGIEKIAKMPYLELLFQGQTNIEKATSRFSPSESVYENGMLIFAILVCP